MIFNRETGALRRARGGLIALVAAVAGMAAFAQPTPGKSEIYQDECRLGTQSSQSQRYHALAYYPNEYALRVPGIVIGSEKSAADQVMRGALLTKLRDAPDGVVAGKPSTNWLREVLQGGRKAVFISHVVAFDGSNGSLIFDAYRNAATADAAGLPPGLLNVPWLDCERRNVARFDAFSDSWRAIEVARKKIASDVSGGGYTHVLLIAMGWNTVQVEAMQNYASIIRNLQTTASRRGVPFRPYVIGFTWPSQWDSTLLSTVLVRPASLLNKANDADEFGAGWLAASIRYAVIPALGQVQNGAKRPHVLAIGHSFGARALSHALCRGSVLSPPEQALDSPPLPAGAIDALVSLQGAYSLNRFKETGAGTFKLAYAPGCPAVSKLVFTASRHDSAAQAGAKLPGPLWAGSLKSWERLTKAEGRLSSDTTMTMCSAAADGSLKAGCTNVPDSRFLYVDASELIKYQSFGTGGGAHSDIYRGETGEFLWNFMMPR